MTSRARPCSTSTRTTDEIDDTSSPRPIDEDTRAGSAMPCRRGGRRSCASTKTRAPDWRGRALPIGFRSPIRSLAHEPTAYRRSTPPFGSVSGRDTGADETAARSIRLPPMPPAAAKSRARARRARTRQDDVRGRTFDEDDGLAVETRIAHHQAGGDRHFDPAVS